MLAYSTPGGVSGLSDLLHSEYDPTYTTDKRVLLAGSGGNPRVIGAFAVMAEVYSGAPTVTAGAVVGTGNGSIGSPTGDVGAMAGLWQLVIIEPATNGGAFEVIRPDGTVDGTGTIGTPYNGGVNFTLADGATDFVAGDRIPLTVDYAATAAKVVQWDPSGTNGSQTPIGLLCFDARAENGVDGEAVVLARGPCVIRREAINWHAGATDAQKRTAYAALEARGIRCAQSG